MMATSEHRRSFAVFDIDGTIIRWQLYHAINDTLVKKGIIDREAFKKVRAARMNWKRRTGEQSFHDYEQVLFQFFEKELHGLKVSDLTQTAEEVFDEYKDQVYTYTRDLIRSLKAKNYLLFAISGSPDIIIEKLVHYYGFDDFAASKYESHDDRFTGATNLSIGKKAELLEALVKKHGAIQKGSIGVGDSEGDIDMLKHVEQPIAFNPSNQLMTYATKHHWAVVVERKNVIYTLNYHNGEYQLTS
jgi:HAD superfamily hydrolase (TIGR01490 family)